MPKQDTTFKKGKSGNPKGKPKGTISHKTRSWQDLCNYLLNEGVEKYLKYVETLEPQEFTKEFKDILNYIRPRLAQTNIDANVKGKLESLVIKWEKANQQEPK